MSVINSRVQLTLSIPQVLFNCFPMSAIIWNIRGMDNKKSMDYMSLLVSQHQPSLLVILEPKVDGPRIDRVARRLHFANCLHMNPQNMHIWLFWKSHLNVTVVEASIQSITVNLGYDDFACMATFVYAKCTKEERRDLWAHLQDLSSRFRDPWMVAGDFNVPLYPHEKLGGNGFDFLSRDEFADCLNSCDLMDVGFEGSIFTWCNNHDGLTRIWERIDRVCVNGFYNRMLPTVKVTHLARVVSDHSPLLVQLGDSSRPKGSFKFLKMWLEHADFHSFVVNKWKRHTDGIDCLVVLQNKLSFLKKELKSWNWQVFGNVRRNLEQCQDEVIRLEHSLQLQWEDTTYQNLLDCNRRLHQLLAWDSDMLRQQSRVKWLEEGDRNSAYFHAAIKERKQFARIKLKLADGTWTNDPSRIGSMAVDHFSTLFSTTPHFIDPFLFEGFPCLVTDADNNLLASVPSMEEIWDAVKGLDPDSAPGLDGFTGHFFQGCWDIVKEELHAAVKDFFCGLPLPQGLSATSIVLIPKVKHPESLNDLRPISLCNFSCKVISKILATRLASILPKLISAEQSGFVKERSIQENIALAQEMVQHLDRKVRGGNMVLKLDMSKAYDRLEWDFLLRTMQAMGFNRAVCGSILRMVSNIHYSIRLNGESFGWFSSSRGVRQGDPLSPLLFILAQEILSFNLNRAVNHGGVGSYYQGRGSLILSHLFYADDSLLFCNGSRQSILALKEVLSMYENASGQLINLQKSAFYVSSRCSARYISMVKSLSGMQHGSLPMKYLGIPLFKGRVKRCYFEELEQKIISRIHGWKAKVLSAGGKLCLLQSVLSSIPVYTLASVKLPQSFLRRLESHLANFLWDKQGEKRHHWIGWASVCKPKQEGGLGLRSLRDIGEAMHARLAWAVLQRKSLWSSYVHAQYFRDGSFRASPSASHVWKAICPLVHSISSQCSWVIGAGLLPFWTASWIGDPLLGPLPVHASLTVRDALADEDVLGLLTLEQRERVAKVVLDPHADDRMIWRFDNSGSFSSAGYWKHTRVKSPSVSWGLKIWQKWLPPKVSMFMWKLLQGALPVDSNLRRMQIPIVSKCSCCLADPQVESISHLFLLSEIATQVWSFFGGKLHLPVRYLSVASLFKFWTKLSPKSQAGACYMAVLFFCCWEIWKARCKCVFEGVAMRAEGVIRNVRASIMDVLLIYRPKLPSELLHCFWMESLHWPIIQVHRKRGKWLSWSPGSDGFYNLFVDGSSRQGLCSGGGIIRSMEGGLIRAFSHFYGPGTNMLGEITALRDGLSLCRDLGLSSVSVASDSKVLVQFIMGILPHPWQLSYEVRACKQLLGDWPIRHVYREVNGVADGLAALAHDHKLRQVFDSTASFSRQIRVRLAQDQQMVPYFRPNV